MNKQMKHIVQLNHQRFKEWAEGRTVEVINPKDVLLTENIHIHSEYINIKKWLIKFENEKYIDKIIVVKKFNDGKYKDKYSLIMGLRWLKVARELDKPINCIVIDETYNHKRFIQKVGVIETVEEDIKAPEGTDLFYPVDKMKVARFLRNHCPKGFKYKKHENYYLQNQTIDKPITVIKNSFVKDGVIVIDEYTRFLVLKNHGINNIPIKFVAQDSN